MSCKQWINKIKTSLTNNLTKTLPRPAVPNVVIDTNILIRALLKSASSDGAIFKQFLNGTVDVFYCQAQLAEIGRVLTYPRLAKKYHLAEEASRTFLKTISVFGKLVSPEKTVTLCRDADDNDLLSVAASIVCNQSVVYLVTADKDLLVLKGQLEGVEIVSPQEFLDRKD